MKNKKITIPFSEEDISDLRNGETFDWTFTTADGQDIDVHIRPETDEDFEITKD